jgi:hypothetical protein
MVKIADHFVVDLVTDGRDMPGRLHEVGWAVHDLN